MLSAPDEIRNLIFQYAELIDAGDFDGLGELFGDAIIDWGGDETQGSGAVVQRMTSFTRRYPDGTPKSAHVITNVIVEMLSDCVAAARSRYTVFQATDALALQPIICGRYEDEFRLVGTTWQFAKRRYIVDLMGNLSAHLPESLTRLLAGPPTTPGVADGGQP